MPEICISISKSPGNFGTTLHNAGYKALGIDYIYKALEINDLSEAIKVSGEVDSNKPGSYGLRYNVKDSAGNEAVTVARTVIVVDTTSPVITLVGEAIVTVEVGSDYEDPGVGANDSVDGDLTSQIKVTGEVDVNKLGDYELKYSGIT